MSLDPKHTEGWIIEREIWNPHDLVDLQTSTCVIPATFSPTKEDAQKKIKENQPLVTKPYEINLNAIKVTRTPTGHFYEGWDIKDWGNAIAIGHTPI